MKDFPVRFGCQSGHDCSGINKNVIINQPVCASRPVNPSGVWIG